MTAVDRIEGRHLAPVPALGQDQLDLLKRTIASDLSNDEFALFAQVCTRTGLDPFVRQIHAVKRGGRMTIQVGIDGLRLIADRTGCYAGSDDAEFTGTTSCAGRDVPAVARVTVWKIVQGLRVAFSASARWDEFYPGDRAGTMWQKMPHVMLGKVAEANALRKAFPAEMSGLYADEEMTQADGKGIVDVPAVAVADVYDPFDGWDSRDEAKDAHKWLGDRIRELDETTREQVRAAVPSWPMNNADYDRVLGLLDDLMGTDPEKKVAAPVEYADGEEPF